jgi:hypothetical protein
MNLQSAIRNLQFHWRSEGVLIGGLRAVAAS